MRSLTGSAARAVHRVHYRPVTTLDRPSKPEAAPSTNSARSVISLRADWGELLAALPRLRNITVLTRNHVAIAEARMERAEPVGLSAGEFRLSAPGLDLRLFPGGWSRALATGGANASIQLLGSDGGVLLKLLAMSRTDHTAWRDTIAAMAESPVMARPRIVPAPTSTPGPAAATGSIQKAWHALREPSEVDGAIAAFGLTRTQAFEQAGTTFAQPLARAAGQAALALAAVAGVPVVSVVGNGGGVQVMTGCLDLREAPPGWFKAGRAGFALHLQPAAIATAWRVSVGTAAARNSWIELHDRAGGRAAMLLGQREHGSPDRPDWSALVQVMERKQLAAVGEHAPQGHPRDRAASISRDCE